MVRALCAELGTNHGTVRRVADHLGVGVEFVMAQLEGPERLAMLPDATTRALVIVIMESGLRASDACSLPFNPIIEDSTGWPCLRYVNTKMAAEQLVPLSAAAAAEAIRAQQTHLLDRWPDAVPVLLPAPHSNPDGIRPFSYATLRQRLARCQHAIDQRDEAGQPVRVTAHQFRHTFGTRLINMGVPQHVIGRLLGHASAQMTARYAALCDATVRAAFDDYCQQRVNLAGEGIAYDPGGLTAEAERTEHNMARVQASLPNGYCGRPPQQDCPHPNACLTCHDFQTTPAYLNIHRRQRDQTRLLIAALEGIGDTTPCPPAPPLPPANAPTRPADAPPKRYSASHATRQPITFTHVARTAGVSRSWLYRQPELRAEIGMLRRATTAQPVPVPSPERGSGESLRQRIAAALDEITRLKADNHQLREHLAQHLGHRRHNRIPDPVSDMSPT